MVKYFYATLVGLVGAAILHLIIVFLLPILSTHSSWNYVEQNLALLDPVEISNTDENDARNFLLDPLFRNFSCRFDLSDGPVQITASGRALFWSLSVYDRTGTAYFSANDRIADAADVDIVVVNQRQLRLVKQNTPELLANALVAAAPSNDGFILLRVFVPDDSWQPDAQTFLNTMACQALVL